MYMGNCQSRIKGGTMKDESILYWIWLAERCGPASKDVGRLVEKYPDPYDVYRLDTEELERVEGISPSLKLKLADKSLEEAYSTLKYCRQKKIDLISYESDRYPSRLRTLEDPPALLFVKGKMPDLNNRLCIAMVGTRKMSEYGCESAYRISYELASANAVIVSGMALGIDGVSACGALSAGGTTVAVLGCGISVDYPKEHKHLSDEIAKHGAVITEYMPKERPNGYNFPKRNRIISGLCQGVLVVEGASGSGALITARRAIDQGRVLFALPGKINESNSEGPNELIKNGALVALSADDIISQFDFLYHDCINYKGLGKAKSTSSFVDSALKKYRVSGIYKREDMYRPHPEPIIEKIDATPVSASAEIREENAPVRLETVRNDSFEGLDEVSVKVLLAMPHDRGVTPDALDVEGVDIGQIITAFTMLEINGYVDSLPGGTYIRK